MLVAGCEAEDAIGRLNVLGDLPALQDPRADLIDGRQRFGICSEGESLIDRSSVDPRIVLQDPAWLDPAWCVCFVVVAGEGEDRSPCSGLPALRKVSRLDVAHDPAGLGILHNAAQDQQLI